jgi:hypothetical protein
MPCFQGFLFQAVARPCGSLLAFVESLGSLQLQNHLHPCGGAGVFSRGTPVQGLARALSEDRKSIPRNGRGQEDLPRTSLGEAPEFQVPRHFPRVIASDSTPILGGSQHEDCLETQLAERQAELLRTTTSCPPLSTSNRRQSSGGLHREYRLEKEAA